MNWQELLYIDLYHGYIPQILIGELIFFLHTERKEHFVHRVCIGLPCFLLLAVLLPNLIAHYLSGFFSLTIFLLSMGFWAYCMDADFRRFCFAVWRHSWCRICRTRSKIWSICPLRRISVR